MLFSVWVLPQGIYKTLHLDTVILVQHSVDDRKRFRMNSLYIFNSYVVLSYKMILLNIKIWLYLKANCFDLNSTANEEIPSQFYVKAKLKIGAYFCKFLDLAEFGWILSLVTCWQPW